MPLDFQKYPLTFAQGLDTKSDAKTLQPGKLLELQNGMFHQSGAISKRYGYQALSSSIDGGDAIIAGDALSTYRDELLAFGGNRVYSRLDSTSKWADRGHVVSIIPTVRDVISNGYEQTNPDLAISDGLEVYAWDDSRGGIRYTVIDRSTGAFIVADAQVTPWGYGPKLAALNGYVVIFYNDVSALKYRVINVATPRDLANEVVFTSNHAASGLYDVTVTSDKTLAYVVNETTTLHDLGSTYDVAVTTFTDDLVIADSTAFDDRVWCLSIWLGASGNVWVGYHTDDALRVSVFGSDLSGVIIGAEVDGTPNVFEGSATIQLAGIETSAGVSTIFWEVEAPDLPNIVNKSTIDETGVATSATVFKRGVGLASKPYIHADTCYINLAYQSDLQATNFTVDASGNIVAKTSPQQAGGYRTAGFIASMCQPEHGVFVYAGSRKGRLISEDDHEEAGQRQINKSGLFSLLGVQGYSFNFVDPNQFQTAELGDNLYVIGGTVQTYDGVGFVEANFHVYPDDAQITVDLIPAGYDAGFPLGNYQYVVCYEATDNNGKIVRSTPSEIITVYPQQGEDGSPPNNIQLTGPMLRLTARENVRIVIYRTEKDLSTFYRVTSVTAPLWNDPTVDTWTLLDDVPDATLISRERLYTEGGVLDNAAPPGATLIHTYRNRVWLAGLENPQELWYSQTLIPGEVVNWSPLLTLKADQRGGKIGALGSLDDALIIFKQGAIFRASGEGPNNLGAGNLYDDPQLVTTDVGCSNPNSVATTPQGLLFQSAKGIMLLGRDYSLQYVGAPVERYNDLTITSTTVVPDQNIVIFTTATDVALVWDYYFNQWATFTNHQASDSIVWRGSFCLLRSSGSTLIQDKTLWTDDGAFIPLKVRTGFLLLAGLMGFQRIRRAAVLGEFKGAHTLRVSVSYDFNPESTSIYEIDPTTVIGSSTWGSGATWGSDATWGGSYTPYYFVLPALTRQLCQSVSFTISDLQTESFNEGFSLSGLTLEVGLKRGLGKVPDAQKAWS